MNKSIKIMLLIIEFIIGFLMGIGLVCCITPGSMVRTETKVVTEPCEHVDLNEVGVLEQSVIPHCDDCDSPAQRILYDSKNDITYIYTYYYKYREGYSAHMLELTDTEILKIQADGTSVLVTR